MKLTAEQRIERAHVRLMQHKDFCLCAGVFMIGDVAISDKVTTACTNGRDVTYGRRFVESLSDKHLAFVVVHEAMHKAYRHLTVWRKLFDISPFHANAAADYVINLQITKMDPNREVVDMPRDADGNLIGLLDTKYDGMDTKQVFDDLMKQYPNGDSGKRKGDGKSTNKSSGQGQSDKQSECPVNGLDEHDWEGAASLDEKEQEKLEAEIDHALREGSISVGKMKGNVPRDIDEFLHPKVDWREALRDFVKVYTKGYDQSTWRKPSKKYLGINVVMPSTIGLKPGTIVLGNDTSGSISYQLQQFMGEMQMIAEEVQPERVEVLYWDTRVAGHETYEGGAVALLTKSTKPCGGGGTAPDCVPRYLIEKQIKPQCVIMFTDGFVPNCGNWSGVDAPVLWCVVGNKQFVPAVGQVVYME
jgi:predicted metal-dependent peptidase